MSRRGISGATPPRIAALVLGSALLVGGCSAGDVELNGGIFDLVGISSKSQSPRREAKLAPRAPLVLPPSNDRLPDPNAAVSAQASADPQWPSDPEEKRRANADQLAKAQADYCRDGNWKGKITNDQTAAKGPAGDCNQNSIFSGFTKWMSGSSN